MVMIMMVMTRTWIMVTMIVMTSYDLGTIQSKLSSWLAGVLRSVSAHLEAVAASFQASKARSMGPAWLSSVLAVPRMLW